MKKVEFTVSNDQTLLIEGIGEELDSVLNPLLSRSITKRGRNNFVLKLGGEEFEYNPVFKLNFQILFISQKLLLNVQLSTLLQLN